MRVLITGCGGYIGTTLSSLLIAEGYHVIGIDNLAYNNHHAVASLVNRHFLFVKQDVRNYEAIRRYVDISDIIIPLAALVGAPICEANPSQAKEINELSIKELIKNISPNQLVLYPNTNSGYGIKGEEYCTEDSPLSPISIYGKTKCEAEKAVLDHSNSVVLRLATVFGVSPRMRFDLMVNNFASSILHCHKTTKNFIIFEPHFKRNFVHVKDVARAFKWAIDNKLQGVYNLGNPDYNISKLALAEYICRKYSIYEDIIRIGEGEDPDKRDYLVSNDKILSTGFTFKNTLDEALNDIYDICKIYEHHQIRYIGNNL